MELGGSEFLPYIYIYIYMCVCVCVCVCVWKNQLISMLKNVLIFMQNQLLKQ